MAAILSRPQCVNTYTSVVLLSLFSVEITCIINVLTLRFVRCIPNRVIIVVKTRKCMTDIFSALNQCLKICCHPIAHEGKQTCTERYDDTDWNIRHTLDHIDQQMAWRWMKVPILTMLAQLKTKMIIGVIVYLIEYQINHPVHVLLKFGILTTFFRGYCTLALVAEMPMKQPGRIWVKYRRIQTRSDSINKNNNNKKKQTKINKQSNTHVNFMGYNKYSFCFILMDVAWKSRNPMCKLIYVSL